MPRSRSRAARAMSSFQKLLPPSMMVSPLASSPESSAIAVSVTAPAGSISQTVRGARQPLHQVLQRGR